MSERSTERLPPMDQKGSSSAGGSGSTTGTAGAAKRRRSEGELSPDEQPGFDEQEAAQQEAVSGREGGHAPAPRAKVADPAELDAARTVARSHMDALDDAMIDYVLAHADWLQDNLQNYLGGTGGPGPVQFESVAVERLATNAMRGTVQAAGRTVGGLVQGSASRASVALGGGALSRRVAGLGAVFGGITGLAVSAIWSLVDGMFERQRANKLVHAATSKLSTAANAVVAQARASREAQLGEWHTRRDGLRNAIDDARSLEELALVQQALPVLLAAARTASAELRDDKKLAKELLLAWYKQTAKNDREAGRDVNPANHEEVGSRLRGSGHTNAKASDMSDLYVEQCRYEWGKLGVDAGEALEALSKTLVWARRPETVLAKAPRRFRFTRVARPGSMMTWLAAEGLAPPPQVVRESTNKPAEFFDEDTDKRETLNHERAATTGGRPTQLVNAVMHGQVSVDCELDLAASDRSTWVKSFRYAMEFRTTSGGQVFVKRAVEP